MRILTLNILLIFCILLNFPLALADHQLKKSTEEILETHNYRMNGIPNKFNIEVVKKSDSPKLLKDNSKPNKKLKKIIDNSDLLSVIYYDGNEIRINEISESKMKENDLMYSMSMGKSYVGYLLGHAVCDGFIKSLDEPIEKYLIETKGTVYEGVTLRELSNMSAGDKFYFEEKGYKFETSKSYATPLIQRGVPIIEFIKKTEKKRQKKKNFFYTNIQTDIVARAIDKNVPKGFGYYMKNKISERAGNSDNIVFLRDKNDWPILFAFLYSSRMDYLRFGKLIYNDWKSDTCISKYLQGVLANNVSSNEKDRNSYKRYGAFFWMGNKSLKFKHLALRGHGGQRMIINLETGAVFSIHSIRNNYKISKVDRIVLKK